MTERTPPAGARTERHPAGIFIVKVFGRVLSFSEGVSR